jgi:hypothetical protein
VWHALILGLDLNYCGWMRPALWPAQIPLLTLMVMRLHVALRSRRLVSTPTRRAGTGHRYLLIVASAIGIALITVIVTSGNSDFTQTLCSRTQPDQGVFSRRSPRSMSFLYREVPNRSWTLVPNCQTLVGIGHDEKQDLENAMAQAPTSDEWRRGFADQSQRQFAEQFADEIVLEATTLAKPVEGVHGVAAVLAAASSIYESLAITAEAQSASTTYLQWRATAFGGMQVEGVTVLERDVSGKIVAAAIHHRPLLAVLRFSAAIRDHLAGVIPADHFVKEST